MPKKGDEIDKDEFLAGVAQLSEEEGDWRDHLPYEAACEYRSDPDIRVIYVEHVDACAYCQDLIELFSVRN